jgi:hypothetical protein
MAERRKSFIYIYREREREKVCVCVCAREIISSEARKGNRRSARRKRYI